MVVYPPNRISFFQVIRKFLNFLHFGDEDDKDEEKRRVGLRQAGGRTRKEVGSMAKKRKERRNLKNHSTFEFRR